jgi:hypothetical protein
MNLQNIGPGERLFLGISGALIILLCVWGVVDAHHLQLAQIALSALGAAMVWFAITGYDFARDPDVRASDAFFRSADPARPLPPDVPVTHSEPRVSETVPRGARPGE